MLAGKHLNVLSSLVVQQSSSEKPADLSAEAHKQLSGSYNASKESQKLNARGCEASGGAALTSRKKKSIDSASGQGNKSSAAQLKKQAAAENAISSIKPTSMFTLNTERTDLPEHEGDHEADDIL